MYQIVIKLICVIQLISILVEYGCGKYNICCILQLYTNYIITKLP